MEEQLRWVSSSYSRETDGTCVEVAITASGVHVRDSRRGADEEAPRLAFSRAAWSLFLAHTTAD
ncbi:DUF397 domain-containing protein [Streptomyces sp. Ru73]|uniref:DUF397 domain-containing protein n=1 Tax=Streptomyces sp. Ru73 TaxID=2080748 RepID=UPI0021565DB0|nr:DUF397 domain-containing protein [Streptomyces sp. Ru73]